jgi:uncharacterized protein YebE (UPF0316 family)
MHLTPETFQLLRGLEQLAFGLDWSLIPAALVAPLVFLLRTCDLSLGTLRFLSVTRGQKRAAWLLGFSQSLFYIVGIAGVITNLDQPINLLAYAAGFATGTVVGVSIEHRIAPGHIMLRISSSRRGERILSSLHGQGIGATEISGSGLEGAVSMIYCYIPRRRIQYVRDLVLETDPDAFIATEQVPFLRGGWRA